MYSLYTGFNSVSFGVNAGLIVVTPPLKVGAGGKTWQQAVQWVEEMRVEAGSTLPLRANHDTYGITFDVDDTRTDRALASTGVPLWDPTWHVQCKRLERFNAELAQSTAQNPLEYRAIAEARGRIRRFPGVWRRWRPYLLYKRDSNFVFGVYGADQCVPAPGDCGSDGRATGGLRTRSGRHSGVLLSHHGITGIRRRYDMNSIYLLGSCKNT